MTDAIRAELVVPSSDDAGFRQRYAVEGFLGSYSGRTLETYRAEMTKWLNWLGHWNVGYFEVTRPHIEMYARHLEDQGLARSTVAKKIAVICSAYLFAEQEQMIARSPGVHVRRPRVSTESTRLGLDRAELAQLLLGAQQVSPATHAICCLLGLNGLRVSEVCSANVDALGIDRGHRTLIVKRKGGKIHLLPLAPQTARAVDRVIGERSVGPIFHSPNGERLTRFHANRLVHRAAKKAGLSQRISPHSCRHAFITIALEAGVPLRDVQDAASHADPRTTMRYDRAIRSLDKHPTHIVAAFVGG